MPAKKSTEKPKSETAKVDTAKVDTAKVDTAKVDTAKVEKPKVEKPKVEKAKVEKPKSEKPKSEKAKVENPKSENGNTELDANATKTVKKTLNAVTGDIHISRPRSEHYLRKYILDEGIDLKLKECKEAQKLLSDETSNEYIENKKKMDELNKQLFRTNQYTPYAISIICDIAFKELVSHGFTQVLQSGKKTLDVSHFYSGNFDELSTFSIIKNLPTYSNFDLSAKKKDDDLEVQESVESTNMSFVTYVTNGILWLKTEKNINITIGTKVKKYLSDLIIDLIRKLSLITKILLKVMNVRTITPNHIKAAVHVLLIEGNVSDQICEAILTTIDEKMKLFYDEHSLKDSQKIAISDAKESVAVETVPVEVAST
jgi:hypothetical protein